MKRSKTLSVRTAVRKTREVRLFLAIACSVVLLSLNLPGAIHADDGDLDPGFGEGGKVTTAFGNGANSIAVQSDGKLVLAGGCGEACAVVGNTDFALARYNGDGILDSSFGANGKVTTQLLHHYNEAFAVAIQTDGKIVAAGGAGDFSTSDGFALVRYNSDGSLDSSFGDDGKVTTAFDSSEGEAYAIAIQSDGMIVAGGYVIGIADYQFALARYKPNGKLDKSFGDGGKVTTSFSNLGVTARSMAIQPDGKIVLAGYAGGDQAGQVDFAIARYNSDGNLDSTFGASGKVTTDLFGKVDFAYAVALQSDGRIVLAGVSGIVPGFFTGGEEAVDFALVRYNNDGSLDTSFGSGGKVLTDFGNNEAVFAVGIQRDGRIVAAGAAGSGDTSDFALARYNSDGSLDSTFGSGGKLTTDFSGWDGAYALAILPSGRIVAAGGSSTGPGFALACYQIEAFTPNITGAEVSGKKLYVYGKYFDNGAELLMNGEKQKKTFNDEVAPATMLVARKSGKNIAPGETVTLQVRNSDGSMSNQFSFARPLQ